MHANFFLPFVAFSCLLYLSSACDQWTYEKSDNIRSVLPPISIVYSVQSVNECSKACSQFFMSTVTCQSFDYNQHTSECYLLANSDGPTFEYVNFTHYEKKCSTEKRLHMEKCKQEVRRFPQRVTVGFAANVVTENNFDGCVQSCQDSKAKYGFNCDSGMFYYSEPLNNCILNAGSYSIGHDMLQTVFLDKVDYFSINCMSDGKRIKRADLSKIQAPKRHLILWPGLAEWGSWTRCDGTTNVKSRYRQCASLNPNKCKTDQTSCDPSARAQEMQDIMAEEGNGGQTLAPAPVTGAVLLTDSPATAFPDTNSPVTALTATGSATNSASTLNPLPPVDPVPGPNLPTVNSVVVVTTMSSAITGPTDMPTTSGVFTNNGNGGTEIPTAPAPVETVTSMETSGPTFKFVEDDPKKHRNETNHMTTTADQQFVNRKKDKNNAGRFLNQPELH